MAGWIIGTEALRNGLGAAPAVHPGLAILTMLAGVSLWTAIEPGPSLWYRRGGVAISVALLVLAGSVIAAPLLGLPRGFDLAPFGAWIRSAGSAQPKPFSTGSAVIFLMLGAGLLCLRGRDALRLLGRSVGLVLALLFALALFGAIYRSSIRGTGSPSGVVVAVGILALAIGLAFPGQRALEGSDAREPAALRGKVSLALGVAVAILIITCGLSMWSTVRSLNADTSRTASQLRRAELVRLEASLLEAEAAQQSYLLTGNRELLSRYRGAVAVLDQARRTETKDTLQARRLADLEPLVEQRVALLDRTTGLHDAGGAGVSEARSIVVSGRGRRITEQVRGAIAVMAAEEDSLTSRWNAGVRSSGAISFLTNLLVGLLAICFLILAGRTISRDFRERITIEAERDRIFTLSRDMLCVANQEGYFKRLNPAFTTTLGWSEDELLRRPFLDFVHPDDRVATLHEVERQTIAGELVLQFENRYLHKNGSWRVLSWKSVPQPGGLMFASARDVTDVHATQAALRAAKDAADVANRAKSDFLAKMSHELRTPLNSIIGFSEIIESEGVGPLTDKQKRYVANVLLSGRNLLQLINDILDLSKVEAGRMELVPAAFDAAGALAEARDIVAPLAEKKGLTLEMSVPDGTPPVYADPGKFKQILFNLLSNAIKFTPRGGRVGVTVTSNPGQVEFAVSDTGVGVAPQHLDLIFREFEQVAMAQDQQSQGTGLGLPLTRKLVELHGGRIRVESEPGKGSVFRFTLPSAPAGAPAAEAPAAPAPAVVSSKEKALVLVVDDDPRARDLIVHYLEHAGYRAASSATGGDAVRLARALQPAVITLDLLLPDRDGLLVLSELKNDPGTRRIPVVVVSITERSELGISLGAEEWLVKPVRQDVFLRALDAAMGSGAATGKRTILVVDDDPAAVEHLSELVRARGCEVLSAPNGREGVAIALRHRPDAIVLDLSMPGMSGFEVVHALRENSRTRATPILVVTAMDLTRAQREQLRAGVQAIVGKGWQEELLTELSRVCHHPAGAAARGEQAVA